MERLTIPHRKPWRAKGSMSQAARAIKDLDWTTGKWVKELEDLLAHRFHYPNPILVNSGTTAITLALGSLPKGRISIPAYCCPAIPNAVITALRSYDTYDCVSLDDYTVVHTDMQVQFVVHTFGQHAFTGRAYPIWCVEDITHCFGTPMTAQVAVCSFAPTKFLAGIGGGAIFVNDDVLAQEIRRRVKVTDSTPYPTGSFNVGMTDVQAAFLLNQLTADDGWAYTKYIMYELAEHYQRNLGLEYDSREYKSHLVKRVTEGGCIVSYIKGYMLANHIRCERPIYKWCYYPHCPNATIIEDQLISFPLYPDLTLDEVDKVCDVFEKCYRKAVKDVDSSSSSSS